MTCARCGYAYALARICATCRMGLSSPALTRKQPRTATPGQIRRALARMRRSPERVERDPAAAFMVRQLAAGRPVTARLVAEVAARFTGNI